MADRDHDHRRAGERFGETPDRRGRDRDDDRFGREGAEGRSWGDDQGYRGQGGEDFGRHVHQGEPTYAEDLPEGARRSKWREDQRYEDTGWMARRNYRGDRDYESGRGGYGYYGAGGFARGGYGQSGYGGDYGQRQHGQTSFGGEGRGRTYGEGGYGRAQPDLGPDLEPDYLAWRNERLASYDHDYEQWRQDQARRHDEEYRTWRGERRGVFHRNFDDWRRSRHLEHRTDELRTDDLVQEITEGHDPFRVRMPEGGSGPRADRLPGDELAAGRNPALERQAEGRAGDHEFPPIPRRDQDARAREAYRGGAGVQAAGENPVLGEVSAGQDEGLLSNLKRRDNESEEDHARRLAAVRAADGAASGDKSGDPGLSANPTLDKLTKER